MCAVKHRHAHDIRKPEDNSQLVLSFYLGSWGLNSGVRLVQQALFSAEPSYQPFIFCGLFVFSYSIHPCLGNILHFLPRNPESFSVHVNTPLSKIILSSTQMLRLSIYQSQLPVSLATFMVLGFVLFCFW